MKKETKKKDRQDNKRENRCLLEKKAEISSIWSTILLKLYRKYVLFDLKKIG